MRSTIRHLHVSHGDEKSGTGNADSNSVTTVHGARWGQAYRGDHFVSSVNV